MGFWGFGARNDSSPVSFIPPGAAPGAGAGSAGGTETVGGGTAGASCCADAVIGRFTKNEKSRTLTSVSRVDFILL